MEKQVRAITKFWYDGTNVIVEGYISNGLFVATNVTNERAEITSEMKKITGKSSLGGADFREVSIGVSEFYLIENETETEGRKNYSEVVPTNDYGTSYNASIPKDKSDFWNEEFASEKTEQIKITQIEKMERNQIIADALFAKIENNVNFSKLGKQLYNELGEMQTITAYWDIEDEKIVFYTSASKEHFIKLASLDQQSIQAVELDDLTDVSERNAGIDCIEKIEDLHERMENHFEFWFGEQADLIDIRYQCNALFGIFE
jgi:hypothetical protein